MAAMAEMSSDDMDFLAKCEEEFKDRFTEKDEAFMKVFNSELSVPPIIDPWFSQNSGRRNDRRNNRRYNPYERHGNRDRDHQDRRDNQDRRGYSDYNRGYDDNRHGHSHRSRPRYY